jgi:hypothetical protein
MARVATRTARLVVTDRVSPEDPEQRTYQNRPEKLRTPSRTYVYTESQLLAALEDIGLVVKAQARYAEQMEVHERLRAAGPDDRRRRRFWPCSRLTGIPLGYRCGVKAIDC